ncbi:ComF family protein [Dactylosporangium aurantiacum]|uniref:ComF family protein n=1 Tax=Dactylosporangium aurantiacum TaxID=35754 RepID=UPI000B0A1EA6|nr:phosphoribosyltransferase family protein [Dactylosporangium aurantiacum]MDG6108373.1 phosphoribosyltransferase family protein [Dactylosporangium aurantiacum]
MLADLLDLVLPATCAGCDEPARQALCGPCREALAAARPGRTRPVPEPPGLPPVYALAAYAGSVRRMLIQYKERNRHELAPVLGGLLARVVLTAVTEPGPPGVVRSGAARGSSAAAGLGAAGGGGVVTLVPVPATSAAARRRFGDHIDRIAREASVALRRRGVDVGVAGLLRALPKREDSVELSAAERARAAGSAFAVRGRRLTAGASTGRVVLVDDIITTGSTLAASAARLAAAGVRVDRVAVLAATQRAT